jgi:apolipoprotein N-acyltransferase
MEAHLARTKLTAITPETRWRAGWRRWLVAMGTVTPAIVAGLGAGFARFATRFSWLVGISLVAICGLLCYLACLSPRPRRLLALACGFAFGCAENSLLLEEFPGAVADYFGFGPRRSLLATVLLGCAHASRHAVWAFGVSEAAARGANVAWFAGLSYVALSALWPRVGEDQLAAAFLDVPVLSALPALGGPQLTDFVLVSMSALAASWVLRRQAGAGGLLAAAADRRLLAVVSFWLVAAASFALLVRLDATPGPALRIAVVQPNGTREDGNDPGRADAARTKLVARALAGGVADLVVWPESGLAGLLPSDPRPALAGRLAKVTIPHLIGADVRATRSDEVQGSALLVGPGGVLDARYDKKGLMPFAERFPLVSLLPPRLVKRWNLARSAPGDKRALFRFAGVRYGVLICYEDLLPGHLFREFHGEVPDLLVSIANDGWFGKTAIVRKHEALARGRAVEWARPLVRVTQTGMTAWFRPDGTRGAELPPFREASALFRIPRTTLRTPFSWLGPWPGPIAGLALLSWLCSRRRRRRSPLTESA